MLRKQGRVFPHEQGRRDGLAGILVQLVGANTDYPLVETHTKRDTRVSKAVKRTGAAPQWNAERCFSMA